MTDYSAEIADDRNALYDLGAGLSTINANMERLQKAIGKATTQITNYSSFQTSVAACFNGVAASDFSGTNRTSAETIVSSMAAQIKNEMSFHQSNVGAMQSAYSSLSTQSANITAQMNDLTQQISWYLANNSSN